MIFASFTSDSSYSRPVSTSFMSISSMLYVSEGSYVAWFSRLIMLGMSYIKKNTHVVEYVIQHVHSVQT